MASVAGETVEPPLTSQWLCTNHWYPVYAFLRRKGFKPDHAKDLMGMFFQERVLSGTPAVGAAIGRGRLRRWLLQSLQDFVLNECDRMAAQKGGGAATHQVFREKEAEVRYLLERGQQETPERTYDRAWARELMGNALGRVREEYLERNEAALFEELKLYSPGRLVPPAYQLVAARLGKRVAAVKLAVTLFRKNVGEALREEIMPTLEDPSEVEDEMHHLVRALSPPG